MKSFNINYLKENLKKSRGLLAFLFGLIPLVDILLLIISVMENKENIYLFTFNNISMVTMIGLYILPLILAFALFSFVFKQKSVDFVMSKPINRKSIYITNIFGGILVLTLFMLLNTLIFGLFGLFCKSLVIPLPLLFDYFLYWLIAYLFVFVVSSLAITLSGNAIGSIVIILLIICMYPFLTNTQNYFNDSHSRNSYITCTDKECKPENYKCYTNSCIEHLTDNEYLVNGYKKNNAIYTAPVYFLNNIDNTIYQSNSLIKMTILSILYLILGYYFFKTRKMENNEISFKKEGMHYFIKTLTIIPVTFILYLLIKNSGAIGLLVSVITILIYYGIYDLITRKELYQIRKSIFICLASFGIIVGCFGFKDLFENNKEHKIGEVKELTVMGHSFTNKTDINKIIKNTLDIRNLDIPGATYAATVNHNEYSMNLYVTQQTANKINQIKQEELKNKLQKLNYNKINYLDNEVQVTKKIKELLKQTLTDPKLEINKINNDSLFGFKIYLYENHDYTKIKIPYGLNEELDNSIMKIKNNHYIQFLSSGKSELNFMSLNSGLTAEDDYIFDYVMAKNVEKFKSYLTKSNTKWNNPMEIMVEKGMAHKSIIITDRESFKKEFEEYKKALANDQKLNQMINQFNKDKEANEY